MVGNGFRFEEGLDWFVCDCEWEILFVGDFGWEVESVCVGEGLLGCDYGGFEVGGCGSVS